LEIQLCSNKGACPFWGPPAGAKNEKKKNLIFKKNLLTIHWHKCIDIWHGTPLGPGDSNDVPGV